MSYIDVIIRQFNIFWRPQTISQAENIYSRFMAGKRNPKTLKLYDEWQRKRFEVESYE